MKKRIYTCVVCPNGCEIEVEKSATDEKDDFTCTGALCPKGRDYVRQEMLDPRRTISSLVRVENGDRPTVSVRITCPVPLAEIAGLMQRIRAMSFAAPIAAGQVLAEDVVVQGCRLIAVDPVAAKNG